MNEYESAKTGAVYYKRQDIGCLIAKGQDRLDLLQRLSTNDILSLKPGAGTATVLTNDKGRIVDLLTIYCFADHLFILCANGNQDSVIRHLDKYTITEDFKITDISISTTVYSLFGSQVKDILINQFELAEVQGLTAFHYLQGERDILACGAWLDGNGYNLLIAKEFEEPLQNKLAEKQITPISPDMYEVLRIESGIPAFGNELNDSHNPLEAGLTPAVSFTKGCYIGQEVIARLHSYNKVQRKLCRVEAYIAESVSVPVQLTDGEKEIGTLTSAATHPLNGRLIGLCYLPIAWQKEKSPIVRTGDKEFQVKIVE